MIKKILILFLFIIGFIINPALADEHYNFNGFIADNARVLNSDARDSINAFLWDLQKKTGTDIAVVTAKSMDGKSIEDEALDIGRKMKLGQKGKNNGAVILVAPNDRRLRIEIGYGLEGIITDGHAGRIRDEQMIPYFKQGDYQSGIWRGAYALASDIAKAEGVTLQTNGPIPREPQSDDGYDWLFWVFVIIILSMRFGIFPIFLPFGGGYNGGGFGGGSFGGFGGGGSFGGGGASGRW